MKIKLHFKKNLRETKHFKIMHKDLKSLVWYTSFFCLHKLGLKDWTHKASRIWSWKEFSALTKTEKLSFLLFLAHCILKTAKQD